MFLHWWILIIPAIMLSTYSITYFLEWRHPRYMLPHVHHSYPNFLQGCGYVLANVFTSWLMASYLVFISKYFPGLFSWLTDNIWLQFLLSILFLDGIMYWWHKINHLVPGLWKYHELHHEEKELNIFSTFHFSPKEIGISTAWRIILLPLMGINPAALIIYNAIFFSVILFHHSNFKLNYFWEKLTGKLIVTPGQHHIHHSVKIQESNSNYGSVFSFWDKIFASHTPYSNQPIIYGVNKKLEVKIENRAQFQQP